MMYGNDLEIQIQNKWAYRGTMRAWGGVQADWAKAVKWLGKKSWNYMDFWVYLPDSIDCYEAWGKAAFGVDQAKWRLEHITIK